LLALPWVQSSKARAARHWAGVIDQSFHIIVFRELHLFSRLGLEAGGYGGWHNSIDIIESRVVVWFVYAEEAALWKLWWGKES
jgi:hypothetical protein